MVIELVGIAFHRATSPFTQAVRLSGALLDWLECNRVKGILCIVIEQVIGDGLKEPTTDHEAHQKAFFSRNPSSINDFGASRGLQLEKAGLWLESRPRL